MSYERMKDQRLSQKVAQIVSSTEIIYLNVGTYDDDQRADQATVRRKLIASITSSIIINQSSITSNTFRVMYPRSAIPLHRTPS